MTVFKTKKYSFEAVRFDGTNQTEIKEFGGDNVHVWPDGTVCAMLDQGLSFNFEENKHPRVLFKGLYLCKDEDGYFIIDDCDVENSRLIEPAITFHAEEEEE